MILAAVALAFAAPSCGADNSAATLICRAVEAMDGKRFADAAGAFEAAAGTSPPSEEKTLRMWAAAGNAWILAGNAGRAAAAIDKAIATPGLDPLQTGLAELDRARAAEMQGDLKAARQFADKARAHNAEDPFTWYFSAALSLRENDVGAAQQAIAQALKLAPDSAEVQFEAGHVAAASGNKAKAKAYWEAAGRLDPGGPVARDAAEAIRLLEPQAGAPTSGK